MMAGLLLLSIAPSALQLNRGDFARSAVSAAAASLVPAAATASEGWDPMVDFMVVSSAFPNGGGHKRRH